MYRTIGPSDEDEKYKLNVLQKNILEIQKKLGIILPDPNLVDREIQVMFQHPICAHRVYDLYPGTYLGQEVWCKKLSYGDPEGKAMMVGEYATLCSQLTCGINHRGLDASSISGESCW